MPAPATMPVPIAAFLAIPGCDTRPAVHLAAELRELQIALSGLFTLSPLPVKEVGLLAQVTAGRRSGAAHLIESLHTQALGSLRVGVVPTKLQMADLPTKVSHGAHGISGTCSYRCIRIEGRQPCESPNPRYRNANCSRRS